MTINSPRRVIGIDGSRATVHHPTGTERYSIELLAALAALDTSAEVRVYFNTSAPPEHLVYPGVAFALTGARPWTFRALAREMRRNPPDLLFVPAHVVPPVHPRTVVTVHDLGYLVESTCHEPKHRRQLDLSTRWNCRAANGIIAVSNATKTDLVERLGVPARKIRVIHHGVSPSFKRAQPEEIAQIRTLLDLPEQFILAVGTIHPRKNLSRLIQAFEQIAGENREIGLVICGSTGWRSEEIIERTKRSPFAHRMHHIGYLPQDLMPAMYSAAELTAFVSLYEGFGFPALESMACGTPVVASHRSSLPEICGDAALFVDPADTASIAAGIRELLGNSGECDKLVERGYVQAAGFSWGRCATETLAYLQEISDNTR